MKIIIGKKYLFEYHCWESEESSDAELWHHTGQTCIVLSELEPAEIIGDTDEVIRMFKIRFDDGFEYDVFDDEIIRRIK